MRNTDDLTVDVHSPDIHLRIEIREDATYLTFRDEKVRADCRSEAEEKRCL
ncbi:hypothetical protein PO124_09690 [Bacillus licheniformis]|nr:hypothetical protein [Bacillus licheniformis]